MMNPSVNPDLVAERAKGSFRSSQLTPYLYGASAAAKFKRVAKLVEGSPDFDTSELWVATRQERYIRACKQAEAFARIMRDNKLYEDEESYGALELMAGEDFFLLLHLTMFVPTIQNLCNEEQLKRWLPLAQDFRIIGTYAQTELAHGSNVAALRTTADFDLETDEWVINTPDLEATKWWPGGLGKSCNCCILMARLRIKGKDYGVHAFFLPVRDFQTHQSLPGVFLIDIGQKMGYNGMDNGGMQLHAVRIPRDHLLQKYVQVDRQGNYKKIGNERMLYATMTYTRKQIISAAGPSLAKAVTIAVRYSAVRRQFPEMTAKLPKNPVDIVHVKESQVLDYTTQQYVLFPMLATAVGFIFAGRLTQMLYKRMITAARAGDFSELNDMHVMTSALKATMTAVTTEGMESCRRAIGGHGYLLNTGIPLQYVSYVPQATYEGDFVVLSIQCGRAFLRMVQKKMMGSGDQKPLPEDSPQKYIEQYDPFNDAASETGRSFDDPEALMKLFEKRTCHLIYASAQRMSGHLGSGLSPLAALDEEKIPFTRMSKAHCHVVVMQAFKRYVEEARESPKVYEVLRRMWLLYACYWIEQDFGEFIVAKAVNAEDHDALMAKIMQLLKEIRPDAVTFADAWGFSDVLLNSTVGRWDGNVYQALFNAALKEPLNQQDVTEGYYRYIQYLIHPERKLSQAKM